MSKYKENLMKKRAEMAKTGQQNAAKAQTSAKASAQTASDVKASAQAESNVKEQPQATAKAAPKAASQTSSQESRVEIQTPREANNDSLYVEIQQLRASLMDGLKGLYDMVDALNARVEVLSESNTKILAIMEDSIDECDEDEDTDTVEVFLYPSKSGRVEQTTDYSVAKAGSIDPEMIRSYIGWDSPGYPKLTEEELRQLGL